MLSPDRLPHRVPRASVIVPAHDEAAVIGRCLAGLRAGIESGVFEVIVVANGCTDRTAELARRFHPDVVVIEIATPGKANAMEVGRAAARADIHVHCDADLEVDTRGIRALIAPLERGEALAACGVMEVETLGATWPVRAFHRVWALNPYFDAGKFGGLFALSAEGRRRVGSFGGHIADDEHARRSFAPHERALVPECRFVARAPATLGDLFRVRRRCRRGTVRLDPPRDGAPPAALVLARRLAVRPGLWGDALVYLAVTLAVRLSVACERRPPDRWERDESARTAARTEGERR